MNAKNCQVDLKLSKSSEKRGQFRLASVIKDPQVQNLEELDFITINYFKTSQIACE